jgi:hypothetical protein
MSTAGQERGDARLPGLPRHVVQLGEEAQVLATGQAPVEGALVGVDEADHGLDLVLVHHVVPADARAPRVGEHQAGQDLQERGLPGPVRSEEAEHLALRHLQGHPPQRLHPIRALQGLGEQLAHRLLLDEALGHVLGVDGIAHGRDQSPSETTGANQRVPPNPSTGRHVESMGARYHRAGLNSVRSSARDRAERGVQMGSMGAGTSGRG